MPREDVLDFISNFSEAQSTFLYGCCYWFTYILKGRFGGSTYYDPIIGHYIQEIDGRFYDVRGDVTDLFRNAKLVCWDTYQSVDPFHYKHLVRDCVLKIKEDTEL